LILYLLLALLNGDRIEKEILLMEEISNKNEKALGKLYDLYSGILFTQLIRIIKIREEAEDLLQLIFLQIWDKAQLYDRSKGTVFSWLIRISRNKAIDFIRTKNKSSMIDFENLFNKEVSGLSANDFPLDAIISAEESKKMKESLDIIPREQKEVIVMSYFEGLSHLEISRDLNIPLGTVKTRLSQGIKKLCNIYFKYKADYE
jgi:RNA polymerase sigma-70 factor, ECF subfamily